MKARPQLRAWLLGLLIAAGLVAAVQHHAELEHFVLFARQARPLWLIAAILLQAATYVLVASSWAAVLRAGGTPRPLRALVPLSISKLFADQAIPTAGLSGNILLVDQLVVAGVPRANAVTALLLSITGYYLAYLALALAVLGLLWIGRDVTPLIALVMTVFLLVAIAIPALAISLARRRHRPLPPLLLKLRPVRQLAASVSEAPEHLVRDKSLLLKTSLLNFMVFLADAATLQTTLLAVGQGVGFDTALIAFIMASIVVTLGPIPLGLGTFEATGIAMLTLLGVPLEAAVAGILLLRGLTLWIPLVPGLVLTRHYMVRRPRPRRD